MKEIPLRAPKHLLLFTPYEWASYVRSLYLSTNENEVASVPGVSISWGKKITIKISRDNKSVTRNEISLIAKEKNIPETELLAAFFKRKIEVTYESSDPRLLADDSLRPKRKTKTNAGNAPKRRRKKADKHQLLEPGHNPDMPTQSTVLIADESSEPK